MFFSRRLYEENQLKKKSKRNIVLKWFLLEKFNLQKNMWNNKRFEKDVLLKTSAQRDAAFWNRSV